MTQQDILKLFILSVLQFKAPNYSLTAVLLVRWVHVVVFCAVFVCTVASFVVFYGTLINFGVING